MARKKQETLVLFPEVLSFTRKMTDAQFGVLIRAAFSYRLYGEVYSGEDASVDLAFQVVRDQIDRYLAYCDTLGNNARGSKSTQSTANGSKSAQSTPPIRSSPTHSNPIQSYPCGSIAAAPQAHTHFSPPSADEVREYCERKGYTNIDPERFISYYAARRWMSGQTAITNWQAAADSWHRKDMDKIENGEGHESGIDRLARMYKEEFGG